MTPSPSAATGGTLHQAILQTLGSAVISLRPNGVITTFNAAAEKITGLASADVVERTFAEAFFAMDDAGDFAQAILDTVYKGLPISQRVVEADFGKGVRILSMSVSRIAGEDEANAGMAVVFEDISELRALRAKELALAQEVEAQHKELRQAYLRLEERNRTLAEANRQARIARVAGLGAVVVLLTLAGLYALDLRPQARDDTATAAAAADPADPEVLTVAPQALTRTIILTGQLAPRREVDVISPITGKIATVRVPYGARVEAGARGTRPDRSAHRSPRRPGAPHQGGGAAGRGRELDVTRAADPRRRRPQRGVFADGGPGAVAEGAGRPA